MAVPGGRKRPIAGPAGVPPMLGPTAPVAGCAGGRWFPSIGGPPRPARIAGRGFVRHAKWH